MALLFTRLSFDSPTTSIGTILACTLILLLLYLNTKYRQTYWSRRGVYSPPIDRKLLGHTRKTLLNLYNACTDRPVAGVYLKLHKPILLLRDPEIIERVLLVAKAHSDHPLLRSCIETKLLEPQCQRKLFDLVLRSTDDLRRYMLCSTHYEGRITWDARSKVCERYAADVAASMVLGIEEVGAFEEPETEFCRRCRMILDESSLRDPTGGSEGFGEQSDYFRKVFRESMTAREEERSYVRRGDIVDLLLENNAEQLQPVAFENFLLFLFLATLRNISLTLSYALLEIAKHPEIQDKVRQEIRTTVGAKQLAYEAVVNGMTYSRQVVREVVRLHPPVGGLIERVVATDCEIPSIDLKIDRGTAVYVSVAGLHMDAKYHVDPERFDPDRFSEKRMREIEPRCTYMPFGPRARVIGESTSLLHATMGLITIMRDHRITVNPYCCCDSGDDDESGAIYLYFERDSVFK